jgi:hypothetical protein
MDGWTHRQGNVIGLDDNRGFDVQAVGALDHVGPMRASRH